METVLEGFNAPGAFIPMALNQQHYGAVYKFHADHMEELQQEAYGLMTDEVKLRREVCGDQLLHLASKHSS